MPRFLIGPFSLSITKNLIAASVFVAWIFGALAPCACLAPPSASCSWKSWTGPASGAASAAAGPAARASAAKVVMARERIGVDGITRARALDRPRQLYRHAIFTLA